MREYYRNEGTTIKVKYAWLKRGAQDRKREARQDQVKDPPVQENAAESRHDPRASGAQSMENSRRARRPARENIDASPATPTGE